MRQTRLTRPQSRDVFARSSGDLLVNDPDGFPSDFPPVWWMGIDSGGGANPIGPNGPWQSGLGSAVPAVTRATGLITGPITAAPFKVALGMLTQDAPRWLTDPMLLRPDERFPGAVSPAVTLLSRSVFWASLIRSAAWYGIGAFLCVEAADGAPLAGSLTLLPAQLLDTERNASGALVWVLGAVDGDRVTFDGDDRVVFERDGRVTIGGVRYRLVVLRNPHSPVDAAGRSRGVFAMHPGAFRLAGQVDTYAQGTFRSGIPAGYLKVHTPGLTRENADELKRRWMGAHGGDRRSIAVLNATTDFQALNLSPVDAALDQVKRLNMADVAFAFGLDPMTLGVGLNNSATYQNLRDAWENHRDFGLAPWTAALEDLLTALLPGTGSVKVNLDGFANPTARERYEAFQVALAAGIITVEEVREAEGLPPLPAAPAPAPAPPALAPGPGPNFTGETTPPEEEAP